jgi:hypothetical protein
LRVVQEAQIRKLRGLRYNVKYTYVHVPLKFDGRPYRSINIQVVRLQCAGQGASFLHFCFSTQLLRGVIGFRFVVSIPIKATLYPLSSTTVSTPRSPFRYNPGLDGRVDGGAGPESFGVAKLNVGGRLIKNSHRGDGNRPGTVSSFSALSF